MEEFEAKTEIIEINLHISFSAQLLVGSPSYPIRHKQIGAWF
jgi:hypothetical protein